MENIFLVVKTSKNTRLDAYVCEATGFSRGYVQGMIKDNHILLNKKVAKSSTRLKDGDVIDIVAKIPTNLQVEAENIPVNIIYQDDYLAIINKEKGLVVHPAPGNFNKTLVNGLLYHLDSLSGINGVKRPGVVHRIDKDTSGILVVAKNNMAHNKLAKQFADHTITRSYKAIVFGNIKDHKLTINAPIGRNPKNRIKMAVIEKNSKNAVTNISVLNRFFFKGNWFSYISAKLETGRTHQIRVHMAHIGYPLLGDKVYGFEKQPFNTFGQVLHAAELGFIHPSCGNYVHFSTPLPDYFIKLLDILNA